MCLRVVPDAESYLRIAKSAGSDPYRMPMRPEAVERRLVKHLAVVRMCDADQKLCALLKRLAVQVHGAIFSDNPVRVGAG